MKRCHAQRRQASASATREYLEPPPFFLPDVGPRHIEAEADSAGTFDVHQHRVFNRARTAGAIHVRANSHRFGKIGNPKRQIDERVTMLEESSATSLGSSEPPTCATRRELILTRPHTDEASELATLQEAIELLNVTAEAMVVADDDFAARLLSSGENAIDAARGERKWALA